ncbi:SMI1/KNR4 family protein [Coprococcus sp. AF21-14LB]|uniref:SMI1/KNR4 family protein n=1 Tax=Coprococcus sp. AF21-14LB TaxID=2292231 RepID=UPI001FA8FB17|nr:SMI1/KNR4 family protein [Coprococcus sp. AF21-14LB]
MMFEDLDKFIAENPEEVLVTGGWTDDKVSELEKQLGIAFREEVKRFIRKYGVFCISTIGRRQDELVTKRQL